MPLRTNSLLCSILVLAAISAPTARAQGGPVLVPDCNNNGIDDAVDVAPGGGSADCNANGIPDECEPDCNANGIPDSCDISSTTSSDCDFNGIPDECDPLVDCNGNGLQDACDLLAGTSFDCNGNFILDECDIATFFSPDCNSNGIPDECDLTSGTSPDCNRNNIPDECDAMSPVLDCDGNGVPDSCDVRSGAVADCNFNGKPDSCETDCNGNGIPDDCDLAAGASTDLNDDGIPDGCPAGWDCNDNDVTDMVDVLTGASADCNGDYFPDECQTPSDCNANSVSDWCDIAAGTSFDSDGNLVPDECQSVLNVPSVAYPTIQSAVTAANSGDLILLATGTYTGPGNRDVDFGGKTLTVRGATGAANVIIDPAGAGRGFYLHSGEPRGARIEQLTIRNGAAPSGQGGGAIYVFHASPTIADCVLESSSAQLGGALYLGGSAALIVDCTFVDNVASTNGGAVYAAASGAQYMSPSAGAARFEGCTFEDNSAQTGGGVNLHTGRIRLVDCGFETNTAVTGGAAHVQGFGTVPGSMCEILHCSIVANDATNGGGASLYLANPRIVGCTIDQNVGGAIDAYLSNPWIERCKVRSNTSATGRAALDLTDCVPILRNTIVAANVGGGIMLWNQGDRGYQRVLITGCTIAHNAASGDGGGLLLRAYTAVQLYDCIVWGNTAGGSGQQIARFSRGELRVKYTDLQGGLGSVYSDPFYPPILPGSFGPGNINVDPQFVNTAVGNFHIQRLSRCIDAGDPAFTFMPGEVDIDGQPRLSLVDVDMGADEVQF